MEKLGFSPKWIELIMRCISTASFSILINGAAKGNDSLIRGFEARLPSVSLSFYSLHKRLLKLVAIGIIKEANSRPKFQQQLVNRPPPFCR